MKKFLYRVLDELDDFFKMAKFLSKCIAKMILNKIRGAKK